MRLSIDSPAGLGVTRATNDRMFAVSPNGERIAYITGGSVRAGGRLVVRDLNRLGATELTGVVNARAPLFSP